MGGGSRPGFVGSPRPFRTAPGFSGGMGRMAMRNPRSRTRRNCAGARRDQCAGARPTAARDARSRLTAEACDRLKAPERENRALREGEEDRARVRWTLP